MTPSSPVWFRTPLLVLFLTSAIAGVHLRTRTNCGSSTPAFIDLGADPPRYLCAYDQSGAFDDAQVLRDSNSRFITVVNIYIQEYRRYGLFEQTRTGIQGQIECEIGPFIDPVTEDFVPNPELCETLRRVALEGLRREFPEDEWLRSDQLDRVAFRPDGIFSERFVVTSPYIPGIVHNAVTGVLLIGAGAILVAWR